ncbi:MAG: GNAT family N-acetyltransferase [Planctomycetota bacterium]|jgi:ribosomal protein S18 acetylase RimI-like enzyme
MLEIEKVPGLVLGAFTDDLRSAAIDDHWLDDESDNRQQGFGKGYDGRVVAREGFLALLERADAEENFGLIGVYLDEDPVGFVVVDMKPQHKIADFFLCIAPKRRRRGLGTAVLEHMMDVLFDNTIYRVQVDLLKINKPGVQFLRGLGFTWESTKRSAFWMDNNVFDIAHLRMLKPHWYERSKEE